MAGAYAAVVTLMHTISQIQHHPRPPISLDKTQVQSLSENLIFLQKFLEDYSNGRNMTYELAGGLVSRIADAAHAAEDIIESRVFDQIHSGSTSECHEEFGKRLRKVVDEMDLIKKDAVEIKETITPITQVALHTRVRTSSTGQNVMVGFDDALTEVMDKLTSREQRRLIIPIIGMGGMGKTVLARNVYSKRLPHFDVCAWTTISQTFNMRAFAIDVLVQVSKLDKEDLHKMGDIDLKTMLHKQLFGKRYLIIMDDIWKVQVWDDVQLFLPDFKTRSRVVATTRLSSFASRKYSSCVKLKFLDDEQSWDLFCKVVYGVGGVCPSEFEEIGKKIAKGCRGLPLAISVIGGLLAKSMYDLEYWGYVAAHLNSVVNLENDGECSKILEMSYSQLPIHLKPCFLHLGVLQEDEKIRVSTLIDLWVVEGFLKPISEKSMEDVALEYFTELVDRNLILVRRLGGNRRIKYCSVHDLLRDFCRREAQKERFCSVMPLEKHNLSSPRRVAIPEWRLEDALPSTQLARSLYYHSYISPPLCHFKFLRIWKNGKTSSSWEHKNSLDSMFHLVNLRYFNVAAKNNSRLSSSFYRFWNLSTIIIQRGGLLDASQIWKMPQLRHIKVGKFALPDPPAGDDAVLENLQTLSTVSNFKCSEEIIKRIPNLKKLRVVCSRYLPGASASFDFLNNFELLRKLESFVVSFSPNICGVFQSLTFPSSLKKLTIQQFDADEFLGRIGSLPHLVKLKLRGGYFSRCEWVTVEGQLPSLRFLLLEECYQLKLWDTESSHFPSLRRLSLDYLRDITEIPLDIGNIDTLESIHVKSCSESVVDSAKKIMEEQEENGNESLQVRIQK